MPEFKFAQLLWVTFTVCILLVFSGGRAEAEQALASWYGPGFYGLPTATGEPYNALGNTVAHKTLPLGTELVVSYGGKSVQVTVNDRGPYVGEREFDLSQGVAQALGLTQPGVDYVEVSYLGSNGYEANRLSYSTATEESNNSAHGPLQVTTQQPAPTVEDNAGYTPPELGTSPYVESYAESGSYVAIYPNYTQSSAAQEVTSVGTYQVKPGDTLFQVATQLGTSIEHLTTHNSIADPNLIYSGQTLYY